MDSFEDVSARVLLRNVLYTEQACSPVTRSMSQQPSVSSGPRRSGRLRKSDAGLHSPQVALRQKLRQNLHKNIFTGSPLQQRKRSLSMSGMMGKVKTPAVVASHSLSEDEVTPRHLLRGILQTEPELSLLVPDRPDSEDPELRSTESSLCSSRPSMGVSHMSNLDLPDLPTVNLTMAVRGISRKRPKKNMNVSVFERKIVDQSGDGAQDTTGNLSGMSGTSASNLSLTLKTPCVDPHVDRRVLRRNAGNAGKRKAISVEDFEAGVQDLLAKKRNPDREQSLSETAGMEKFTLGLSNVTTSNISGIVISNTASIAMHDWDTIVYSPSHRGGGGGGGVGERILDEVEKEKEMQVEQQMEEEEVGGDVHGDTGGVEGRAGEKSYEDKDTGALLDEVKEEVPEGSGREGADEQVKEEEGEEEGFDRGDIEANMENAEDLQAEEELARVEEAETVESEEEEEPEREEEEQGAESEEEAAAESEVQEDEVVGSESEEEEKDTTSDREEGGARGSTWTQEEGGATEHETQEEEVASGQEQVWEAEHISRRACRSEGGMKIPGMEAGGRGYKSLSSGLQPMGTELESGDGQVQSVKSSEGGASSEWQSGPQEGSLAGGDLPPQSPVALSPASSPNEIPPSAEYLHHSRGRSLLEEEDEENMGGATESETQEGGGATESETQEEEVASGQEQVWEAEHISRRACRSEGGMKIPGMEAGGRGYKSLSSGLQPMGTELESGDGQVQSIKSSEGRPSSEWQSGPQESLTGGDLPPQSPSALSPASSPNEIPPSPEHLHSSRGRSLLEEEEDEEEEEEEEEEENMGGANYADEAEDKESSIPLLQPGSPELQLTPRTPHASTRVEPSAGMRPEEEPGPSEDDDDDEGEEDEDDLSQSDELPLETPAFVRERKHVLTPGPSTTPNFLKQMMDARKPTQAAAPAAKPKPQRKGRAAPSQKEPGLPKSYVMTAFKHFAKTTVSSEAYPVLKDIMAKYFDRLADDLEAYATHAKRKTIEMEDVVLLMRRQGFVTDSMPVNVLIEKYLPNEYRKLLIPVATSGNKIIPKQKR
ncbi:centromere protein T isoform X2 [Anguilla rostrata]|uniref:centromere protein T isoform X2 n=1 Tax=Anguilla rostrata TaxID=7938 RepID=UPI0030D19262